MSLYERIASEVDGPKRLAGAELRQQALAALRNAFDRSGLTQSALAKTLGLRKSAVSQVLNGNGNVTINTLSDYVHACGYEVKLQVNPLREEPADAGRGWKTLVANTHVTTSPSHPQKVVLPSSSRVTSGVAA